MSADLKGLQPRDPVLRRLPDVPPDWTRENSAPTVAEKLPGDPGAMKITPTTPKK